MSAPFRHKLRRRRRLTTILAVLAASAILGGAGVVSAQSPAPVAVVLSADEATRAGLAIPVTVRSVAGGTVAQVDLAPAGSGRDAARRTALGVLSTTPDGAALAIADRIDDPDAGLIILHGDGSQVRVALPGASGAAFAAGGALAVVDGQGRLWNVDATTGSASRRADGPYVGAIAVDRDGAVLAIAVASVEAPYSSRLVRVSPEDGNETAVRGIDAPLVMSVQPLADGSLAVVVHRLGSGIAVQRLAAQGSSLLAYLGPLATDVAVSVDGSRIAYAVVDDGVYVVDVARGATTRLGAGSLPRFAPDASAVLVTAGAGSAVIGLDGQTLGYLPSPAAAWLSCAGECQP